ncbi:MAG: pyridoxamine 5'-phosphate oxidase family protein [Ruminococcaceae bacterium]|nr:pyridoxamine 5'-phosphate oxidase family protein [Oscillospiraceae bacterium]
MFREITRKKQALDTAQITEILKREKRGVLSVHGDDGYPYGVPINFWYNEKNGYLYFHSGKSGHKADAVAANNKVSFCVYDEGYRNDGEWALNIRSVIVFGTLHIVEDPVQTDEVYRCLSRKFTDDEAYIEAEIQAYAKATRCYELRVEHITGKLVNEA